MGRSLGRLEENPLKTNADIKPELVAPAGEWASLTAAIEAGTDAVYFGVRGINMRHMATNFQLNEIAKVMRFLKENGTKGYLTMNTVMMPSDLARVRRILTKAKDAGVDAVILWDMAVLRIAKELKLRIHISTQASVANAESAEFYAKLGAKQIVLARECTLKDVAGIVNELKSKNCKCLVETFIHGAMCVSVSGRCFLSQHTFGKSANQGKCIQPCRREYYITDAKGESEYILGSDYVLSPKDLCCMDFLDKLIRVGVHSFKIEGRMRSPEYVRVVTACYREAIDAYFNSALNDALKRKLKLKLKRVYNRGFSEGFFFGQPQNESWSKRLEHTHEKVFVGEVTQFFKKISVAAVHIRTHKLFKGAEILVIGNRTPGLTAVVEEMKLDDVFIKQADKGDIVGIKLPFPVRPKDKVFLWRERE